MSPPLGAVSATIEFPPKVVVNHTFVTQSPSHVSILDWVITHWTDRVSQRPAHSSAGFLCTRRHQHKTIRARIDSSRLAPRCTDNTADSRGEGAGGGFI